MLIPTLIATLATGHHAGSWHIEGTLSEACSCSVPCPCNFGDAPSPHHFCYAMVAMHIDKGSYGDVSLDGLEIGGANGAKGFVFYVDEKADEAQAKALRQIAMTMVEKAQKANGIDPKKAPIDFRIAGFARTNITHEIGPKANVVKLGKMGGFTANYIMGIDGKTPVRVMNNASFNFKDGGIKGKTKFLRYRDVAGNDYDFTATNANQGRFDWSDQTPVYFK